MTTVERRQRDALLRNEFRAFLHRVFIHLNGLETFHDGWHLQAMEHHLKSVERGGARLIFNVPPRSLKSISISVAYVAWRLGRDPRLRFVCVSYAQDLSLKLARDCRDVMLSDWYRELFPETILSRTAEAELETTEGGGRLSTSTGGVLTGRGGDIIIIDDPTKPGDMLSPVERAKAIEWFGNTLQSRLDDKVRGSIILVMQRLHEEDLSGHLLEGGGWDHLSLSAIAEVDEAIAIGEGLFHYRKAGDMLQPTREPLEELERLRVGMGSANFSAQYQQQPVPVGGAMVKRIWFREYAAAPQPRPGDMVVQSWDCASKDGVMNDHSVCITALIRDHEVYLLDVWRGQVLMHDLLRQVTNLAHQWGVQYLLVEDAASGMALIQLLRADLPVGVPRPIAITPKLDKLTRLSAACPRIEAGEVLIPAEAPWLATFLRELLAFPRGRFDDQVDALSQLLNWHGRRCRESVPAGPVSFTPDPFTGRTIIAGDAWWLERQSADERDQPDVLRW